MSEVERPDHVFSEDPFEAVSDGKDWKEIAFMRSQCSICGACQPDWFHLEQDEEGRVINYPTYDIEHTEATGHRQFWHYTLKRNRARVMRI